MDRLAVQVFLDGFRDHETRQALIFVRNDKLVDALVFEVTIQFIKQLRLEDRRKEFTIDEVALRARADGSLYSAITEEKEAVFGRTTVVYDAY